MRLKNHGVKSVASIVGVFEILTPRNYSNIKSRELFDETPLEVREQTFPRDLDDGSIGCEFTERHTASTD
jgi:hypothetical protein